MGRKFKKIKYNEHIDMCVGHNCPARMRCYRFQLNLYYDDPKCCKNPPKIPWFVEPKYNTKDGYCDNFEEIVYK